MAAEKSEIKLKVVQEPRAMCPRLAPRLHYMLLGSVPRRQRDCTAEITFRRQNMLTFERTLGTIGIYVEPHNGSSKKKGFLKDMYHGAGTNACDSRPTPGGVANRHAN